MQLSEVIAKYPNVFKKLEELDRTGKLNVGRKRIDVTLDRKTIEKLNILSSNQGKPFSRIIDEAVDKFECKGSII